VPYIEGPKFTNGEYMVVNLQDLYGVMMGIDMTFAGAIVEVRITKKINRIKLNPVDYVTTPFNIVIRVKGNARRPVFQDIRRMARICQRVNKGLDTKIELFSYRSTGLITGELTLAEGRKLLLGDPQDQLTNMQAASGETPYYVRSDGRVIIGIQRFGGWVFAEIMSFPEYMRMLYALMAEEDK
jgi:hypothetical protein